ncbi:hypothetical protein LTR70_000006 [Exophiala xenobiotica]|uniref:Uncharacterized protein n=1 Tax=Lithohypha guttulata TaxID=1690604 RepID=A0ABR0K4D6_9EURO|nr:hypothetical protein LTR24_006938 [Lithohypha guttulata]KAK5330684.1 hypothetical protein LTR70_000006 [Exophiala xenobiotica]
MSEHKGTPRLQNKEKDRPEHVKQTSSHSSGSSISADGGEADLDPGAEIGTLDEGDQAELFLSGLLNALKHNEAAVIGGLLHSLRHDGTPQEVATHLRHNFKSLQDRGIMPAESLDEEDLLTIASQSAGPQVRSTTQPEGSTSNFPQSLNEFLSSSTHQPDEYIPCPCCQALSK